MIDAGLQMSVKELLRSSVGYSSVSNLLVEFRMRTARPNPRRLNSLFQCHKTSGVYLLVSG